jgi:small subunit ribosomal protein S9
MTESANKTKYFYGTGRRKTAIARVRLYSGVGKITINGKESNLQDDAVSPLKLVGKLGSYDISITVTGGGTTGQSDAIRHGIALALIVSNAEYRPTLKKAGYLTRDPREVERKKPGLKKARRAPQWSKR